MKYKTNIALDYNAIFNDYETVDPRNLIANISTKNSLEIIGYFIAQVHTKERSLEAQIDFLNIWGSRLPNEIILLVNDFIRRTYQEGKSEFNFINNIAASILIEIIIENTNDIEPVENLTPQQELDLFKAYLWCNQYWTDKQLGLIPKSIETVDDLISVIFPVQLPYMEILEFKDFRLQFLKAVIFFKFCDKNEIFKIYLNAFLAEYNINTWQKYLTNILSLYIRRFEELRTPSIVNISNDHPEIKDFINQFCVDLNDFAKSDDFTSLRKTPIYKVDDDNFLFLNLNFFVDKLFQGIQFELFRVIKKQKLTYNKKPIKTFDQFRSIYAEQISEKGIFYETLKYSFAKNGYKLMDGDQLHNILGQGEPDFYIRDKDKIYLFEYKDIILNADVKHSYNFETIKDEISTKMISNQVGSQKGITQLFNSISNIRKGDYDKVDDYKNLKDCIIYPIIVFTDFSFNLPGINHFLNNEFFKLIYGSDIKNKESIKDLTLIDIDTFLKFQDLFRSKKLKINNCLSEYHSKTKKYGSIFNLVETFNIFIHDKTMHMDYGTPQMLHEEVEKLLDE